jgi:type VI secretion system secreted protein Hcp
MAVQMFLKIDGIDGDSADARHRGEIDVAGFAWGEVNAGSPGHGGGGGAGRVSMQDFVFTAPVSKASPQLFVACASGQHLPSATLTVRRAGAAQLDFLKVTLTDVLITSWKQTGAAGADVPLDEVALNFARVQIAYTGQRPDGAPGDTVSAGWDVKTNTPI